MILGLFKRRTRAQVTAVYTQIVAQARQPEFYSRLGVPDTVDGRFELIMLHMILVIDRLRGEPSPASDFTQDLFDLFFQDMDHSLREMGVGDLSVPKKVKKMAEAFYGRAASYSEALREDGNAALCDAVDRNFFVDRAEPLLAERIALYIRASVAALATEAPDVIMTAKLPWPNVAAFVD